MMAGTVTTRDPGQISARRPADMRFCWLLVLAVGPGADGTLCNSGPPSARSRAFSTRLGGHGLASIPGAVTELSLPPLASQRGGNRKRRCSRAASGRDWEVRPVVQVWQCRDHRQAVRPYRFTALPGERGGASLVAL